MNYLTADERVCGQLAAIQEPVEIRDKTGKLLGHYTPAVSAERNAAYEKIKASIDVAEMRRRKVAEHGKGRTTAEVLKRLELHRLN